MVRASISHQPVGEVDAIDMAVRDCAARAVVVDDNASYRAARDEVGEFISRELPATTVLAAQLAALRRVNAGQTNARAVDFERVGVDDAGPAGKVGGICDRRGDKGDGTGYEFLAVGGHRSMKMGCATSPVQAQSGPGLRFRTIFRQLRQRHLIQFYVPRTRASGWSLPKTKPGKREGLGKWSQLVTSGAAKVHTSFKWPAVLIDSSPSVLLH
jgi:hypothetical protein